jgi:hypothetical protein
VVYEYADGAKLFANTRQMAGCAGEVGACAVGSKGSVVLAARQHGAQIIAAGKTRLYRGETNNMYETEHDVLFSAIRSGTPVNNGEYMSKSTLLAILGRMATYTGQKVTWEQALNSKEDLTPPGGYKWGPTPVPSVAIPGVTQLL